MYNVCQERKQVDIVKQSVSSNATQFLIFCVQYFRAKTIL